MKKLLCILFTAIIALCSAFPAYAGEHNTLTIDKNNISHKIPQLLYGISIDDNSFSADGGLVSNLVNNGSFEYAENPNTAWIFKDINAMLSSDKPMNSSNTAFQTFTVDGRGVIENLGFTELYEDKSFDFDESKAQKADMGFKEGEKYDFSCYVRNIDFEGTISVYLDSKSNSQNIIPLSTDAIGANDWTKLSTTLTSVATENGGLAIVFNGNGSLAFDFVSLIPKSSYGYGNEEWKYVSLRNDLFEALKNLKPAFIRFPGGCLTGGTDLNNLYCWKNTIGAVEQRKQEKNPEADTTKNYNNTNSMGYHEYFQLCEDLGAAAVPVVNAGMTCQDKNGYDNYIAARAKVNMSESEWQSYLINERGFGKKDEKGIAAYTEQINSLNIKSEEDYQKWVNSVALKPESDAFKNYVQDILDLIEYANGNAETSYWGALRAANGHTQPFNMEYIQIGSKARGDIYFRNFDAIYKAIKKKHPKINIITSEGSVLNEDDFDSAKNTVNSKYSKTIAEENYYLEEYEYSDRFDSYDRDGAAVLIGEYAASDAFSQNIFSAVKEAAFMTALERNSDIVKMASCAPAFAKIKANAPSPALIWFNSQELSLTPDYYNQLIFSNNTGMKYIETSESIEKVYQSVTVDENKQVIFVKLVNTGKKQKLTLNLKNFDEISAASLLTLSSKSKSASNEIGKQYVAPKEKTLEAEGSSIEIELDKNSSNVLRIAYGEASASSFYAFPETLDFKTKAYHSKSSLAIILLAFAAGMAAGLFIYFKAIGRKYEQ